VDGYLTRLVTRNAVLPGFQPQVRSASPIAQDDQRLGMPGFEEAPLAGPLMDLEPEPSILTDSPSESAPRSPRRDARQEGVRAALASAIPAAPSANSTVDRELQPEFPQGARELALPPNQQPSSAAIPEIHPAQPQTDATPAQHFELTPPPRIGIPSSAEPEYESSRAHSRNSVDDVETPLLEPAAQQIPAASARTSTSDEEAASEAVEEREPRIVIGRINVEVIPAAPEPAKAAPARPKPLTAAAASVIGPLSTGVRTGRLLSLRYR
jgi:hypothetical protein